jgi:hypothetical protein
VNARDDEVERALGRSLARWLPLATLGGAIVVGAMAGIGSALLVLAAGALLGAIGLLWASVRTLSGDAPLAAAFEPLTAGSRAVDLLSEEKIRLLRTLKDLEGEHALGKLDDRDYEELATRYRKQAKAVIREMDVEAAPFREQAEKLAREHLKTRGLTSTFTPETPAPVAIEAGRIVCGACSASNEADAAFCKQCGMLLKTG